MWEINISKDDIPRIDGFLYLDLQSVEDRNKLNEPRLFFEANRDAIICLDEIQLIPELLQSYVRDRPEPASGTFYLLGSASRDLVQKTSESLAGRVGMIELTPFTLEEVEQEDAFELNRYWVRGGYPDSYLAASDSGSVLWRENFLRTYVERDIPQLGFQISAIQIRRLLTMCAHVQGQLLNLSKLGNRWG